MKTFSMITALLLLAVAVNAQESSAPAAPAAPAASDSNPPPVATTQPGAN